MSVGKILCVAICCLLVTVEAITFRVAWLCPASRYNDLQAASSIGALGYAISDVEALGSDTFVPVSWKDSDCKSNVALARIYDIIVTENFNPDVIIGPPCSTAMTFIAQLTGFRNLPVIGWASPDPSFADKSTYNTFIRVLPPISAIATGLFSTLNTFSWKNVFLLSSEGNPYNQLGTAVNDMLLDDDTFKLTRWIQDEGVNPSTERIKEIFTTMKKEARIMLLVVPQVELRSWMIVADDMDLTGGEYVYIYLNGEQPTDTLVNQLTAGTIWKTGDDDDDKKARKGFENLLMFLPEVLPVRTGFYTAADTIAPGYTSIIGGASPVTSDEYSPFLYDAVRVYVTLANEANAASLNYRNGSLLLEMARNRIFSGSEFVTGDILMDENADRRPDFRMYDLREHGTFLAAMSVSSFINGGVLDTTVAELVPIIWGDGREGMSFIPPDVPACGFTGEKCPNYALYIAVPVVVAVLILIGITAFLLYRRQQFEQSLKDMSWKIGRDDIKTSKKQTNLSISMMGSRASVMQRSKVSLIGSHVGSHRGSHMGSHLGSNIGSVMSLGHRSGTMSVVSSAVDDRSQIFMNVAHYQGSMVAVKKVRKQKIKLDRALLVEMRAMMNMKSGNLAMLIGATTDPPEIMEVWEYCAKGSLQDVIWNDNITLDGMFKFSMAIDIFKGLKYLHDSPLKVHGKLKSSNCVIDGRWACKLTDYGLFRFRDGAEEDPELSDYAKSSRLYWSAPEILRTAAKDGRITAYSQEADIYAGAIILKEVFARNGPYTEHEDDLEPNEIIEKVKAEPSGSFLPFRPVLTEVKGNAPDKMLTLIKSGWSEKPGDRPSVGHILKDLQKINPNKSANVMDNMIRMMERYSNHLEELVGDRTVQVEEEKKKSEMLLYRMLPRPIAEELKKGESVAAESFDSVSIYFSDIVKFTNLSAASTPMQVVDLLNRLYTIFDSAIAKHDVYKVETIGDAYMLVSGLPNKNGDQHAAEIANAAMDLLSGIVDFKVAHMPDDYVLKLRIGLHTGPAVAGVVGVTMPRYCLFGNTVSIASTMESGGMPMRIQLSQYTYELLRKFSGYHLVARNDPIDIKGLGNVKTYWLINREGYNQPMPDFNELSTDDSPKPTILPVTVGKTFRSSVTESGIFELETDDKNTPRKTSLNDPNMFQIQETSNEDMKKDNGENLEDSTPEFDKTSMKMDDKAEPVRPPPDGEDNTSSGQDKEVSWAQPGSAAKLKEAVKSPKSRPSTASSITSIRSRLSIPKPATSSDLTIEDTYNSEEEI